ncbi:SgcJ/EcaC family oxidoreductase [Bradyrhizobium sp. CCGUVB14]|uniref:SgcJ/EcaC family oxidoreductase n=1 Tax=Bradyrhizobium sp. CCGUVB14 TaxID=2949628 RepID=UPI0020B29108|nr:SgcJ/EcaC family oxidoreductase [Bradyrhizobium sp. CCGUVB14]MCP3444599.1 SgcJ/EcaC family oxidoreductase [Bradyrhizobium sp. CCGUVB14]
MLRNVKLASVALVMIAGAATGAQAKSQNCPVANEGQIEALFATFNGAWATKDPAKVTALFTKHPVLLATVSNTPRTTRDEVNDYFVKFLKSSPVGRIDTSTVEIDCRTASRVGTWTVSLTDPASGSKSDVKARYSFIYRYEDGAWKIDHLHSSMMPEK